MYRTMGDEMSGLALWVNGETNRMKKMGLLPPDDEDYIPDCLLGRVLFMWEISSPGDAHESLSV